MSQGLDIDLKEIVLSNSTFGPNEIEQLTQADLGGHVASGRAARLGGRVGGEREPDAGDGGSFGGVLLPAWAERPVRSRRLRSADGSALALFYLGRSQFASGEYVKRD